MRTRVGEYGGVATRGVRVQGKDARGSRNGSRSPAPVVLPLLSAAHESFEIPGAKAKRAIQRLGAPRCIDLENRCGPFGPPEGSNPSPSAQLSCSSLYGGRFGPPSRG